MGARTRPDPWPSLGVIIVDPDTCIGSASQLEGEQNIHVPCVGSELHAAPSAPQIFSSLPPDTLAHKNSPCGEAAAIERRATKDSRHPEPLKPPDEDLQESGGASALGDSPFLPGDHSSPRDLDSLGPACTVADVDMKEVEPSCVDAHKQGGVLPVTGVVPALAEDTVSVGPADKAETASAAKPEALVSWAQEAGRGHEVDTQPPREALRGDKGALGMSLQKHEHKHAHKPPPEVLPRKVEHDIKMPSTGKGERAEALLQDSRHRPKALPLEHKHERRAMPQGSPNKGKGERGAPPQRDPDEGALATWDPGGKPAKKDTIESKGPVEAMDVAPGIVAHKKSCTKPSQSGSTVTRGQPRTWYPSSIIPSHHQGVHAPFVFEAHREGTASSWKMQRQRHCKASQCGHLVAVTPESHAITPIPTPCTHWCTGRRNSTCSHKPLNTILVCPHICLEAFRCSFQTVCEMRGSVANGTCEQIN